MFQLEWPLVLLLAPLPALVYFLLPIPAPRQLAALRVPVIDDFRLGETETRETRQRRWRRWFALLAWLLLVLATSRPQWLSESVAIPVSGRDLGLAVGVSDSMRAADFMIDGEAVNRLRSTKHVSSNFIELRCGDRLVLILFGIQVYL